MDHVVDPRGGCVIITSRMQDWPESCVVVGVGEIKRKESVQLLRRWSGEEGDMESCSALCDLLQDHPVCFTLQTALLIRDQ